MLPTPLTSGGALIKALRQFALLTPDQLAQLPHLPQAKQGDPRYLARFLAQKGWLTIYQLNQILLGRAQDLVIGPYHVLDRLGAGGLSTVYKAKHILYNWLVALKVIKPEMLANIEGKKQFLLEMEAMARLDHPNIVQFCDVDQDGETFYYAMEYVEGIDLGKLIRLSGPLPVHEACDCIRQTALGLQHSYERNLVHRDIKPGNLYLTQFDPSPAAKPLGKQKQLQALIKILDWGLANLRSYKNKDRAHLMQNLVEGIIGTPDYMSPEQAQSADQVDIRSDIYSLGCTFYYLLTRLPPFPEGTLMQKLIMHQKAEPEPVENFRSDVAPEVKQILLRMIAKKKENRFATPAAIAAAISPFCREKVERRLRARVGINEATPLPVSIYQPLPAIALNRTGYSDEFGLVPELADTRTNPRDDTSIPG